MVLGVVRLAVLAVLVLSVRKVQLVLVLSLSAINSKQILMLCQLAVLEGRLQRLLIQAQVGQAAAVLAFAILRQVNC